MKRAVFAAGATISACELQDRTGIYPQLAYAWKKRRNFPPSSGGKYDASELIAWLRNAGYHIEVI